MSPHVLVYVCQLDSNHATNIGWRACVDFDLFLTSDTLHVHSWISSRGDDTLFSSSLGDDASRIAPLSPREPTSAAGHVLSLSSASAQTHTLSSLFVFICMQPILDGGVGLLIVRAKPYLSPAAARALSFAPIYV